jgi:hypothetical protein
MSLYSPGAELVFRVYCLGHLRACPSIFLVHKFSLGLKVWATLNGTFGTRREKKLVLGRRRRETELVLPRVLGAHAGPPVAVEFQLLIRVWGLGVWVGCITFKREILETKETRHSTEHCKAACVRWFGLATRWN